MISDEQQLKSILESISSMALSDYSKKAIVTDSKNQIDSIAAGINSLSEQIKEILNQIQLKTDLLNKSEEISNLGSWMLNLKTNTLTWSDENYRIFGLQPQEFEATYEAFLEIVHPDDRVKVDEAYSGSLAANNDGYEIEHRIIHKHTGEIRYVQEKCIHNRDTSGTIINSIGYTHDLTQSLKSSELIMKSEQRLNTAQRIAKIGSWELDLITDELTWSNEMFNLLGFNPENDRPNLDLFTHIMNEENQQLINNWISTAKLGLMPSSFDFSVTTQDGETKWLNAQGEVIIDENNKPVRAFGTAQDITESKNAFDKEKQLHDLKSRFLSIASHQFRTPMTVIRSNSQLLNMLVDDTQIELKPKLNKIASRIQVEIMNMTSLMDDILILEKINTEENLQTADKISTNLIEFCSHICTTFKEVQLDGRQVEIEITGAPNNIKFDRKHLDHVISNLLSNAFKYSSEQNPVIHISFDDEMATLRITDYGIGIPEDDIPNLFQPFHRAKNVVNIAGSGLGLSIAKEYVELGGGEINVKSKLNESTTFIVTIPNN